MSMFDAMRISASGLSAERVRMDVVSQNLANVDTTRGPDGQPYRRKEVVFQTAVKNAQAGMTPAALGGTDDDQTTSGGVEVVGIVDDPSPLRVVHDPSHPDADDNGNVTLPNVNSVTEMTDMMTATRAYEANVTAMNAAKSMAMKALDILR